jgi:cytidylate kinase
MIHVCIAREHGLPSDEVAERVAELLGLVFVDKAALEADLKAAGLDPGNLARYDEKKPGFWASLSLERDAYFHHLRRCILARAAKAPSVFLGRGAGAVLKPVPGVLRARLCAPAAYRANAVATKHGFDLRYAERYIEARDKEREGFHRFYFGMDWRDPSAYDISVNLERFDQARAAEAIVAAAKLMGDAEGGEDRVRDLLLAEDVLGELQFKQKLQIHFLECSCDQGKASLRGICASPELSARAKAAALGVPGVTEVIDEIQIVHEYPVLP